jgi:uncharacterized RDD family membrane protein YckC
VYADVPNRVIAYIIDAILIGIINFILLVVLAGFGLQGGSIVTSFVVGIIGLLIGAAYFIYTWTRMRATVGMRLLGMQIGNAGDGKTMTTEQGIRRWLALSAPAIIAQAFSSVLLIGFVVALAAVVWYIWLLYTMANSPTKQGWHDVFANTQVVKAARTV